MRLTLTRPYPAAHARAQVASDRPVAQGEQGARRAGEHPEVRPAVATISTRTGAYTSRQPRSA